VDLMAETFASREAYVQVHGARPRCPSRP
jgi:hypothetical protein